MTATLKIHGKATHSLPKHLISGSIILSATIFIALTVFFDFWVSTLNSNEGFVDWFKGNWIIVSIRSAIIAGVFWWYLGTRETVWDAMYADYSTAPDFGPQSRKYPTVPGIMKVDEEEFEISTTPTEAGLVLSRPSGDSLFFPWLKIREIRVKNESGDLAMVQIRRRVTIPLELEIPWKPEFRDDIGADVKYFFAPEQLEGAIKEVASRVE